MHSPGARHACAHALACLLVCHLSEFALFPAAVHTACRYELRVCQVPGLHASPGVPLRGACMAFCPNASTHEEAGLLLVGTEGGRLLRCQVCARAGGFRTTRGTWADCWHGWVSLKHAPHTCACVTGLAAGQRHARGSVERAGCQRGGGGAISRRGWRCHSARAAQRCGGRAARGLCRACECAVLLPPPRECRLRGAPRSRALRSHVLRRPSRFNQPAPAFAFSANSPSLLAATARCGCSTCCGPRPCCCWSPLQLAC
jgi:hypothetical protein